MGKWYNSLDIRTEELVWARGTKDIPISACSLPCEPGMIKKQQGDTCCWVCDQCEAYEFVYDEYTCMDCGPGFWPHPDKRGCYQLPIKHIRWASAARTCFSRSAGPDTLVVRGRIEGRDRKETDCTRNVRISQEREQRKIQGDTTCLERCFKFFCRELLHCFLVANSILES